MNSLENPGLVLDDPHSPRRYARDPFHDESADQTDLPIHAPYEDVAITDALAIHGLSGAVEIPEGD